MGILTGIYELVANLLAALGVNETFWIHLGCFLVSYVALTQLVFKPYLRAFAEREKRTVGNEETAVRLVQEASDLHGQYEQKAKAINSQIKAAFDSSRSDAQRDYDKLIQSTRGEVGELLKRSRESLARELQNARKAIITDIPAVSQAIASKLAGKDLSK